MKKFEIFCMVLLIASGLLWGLVGLFDFDMLGYILGPNWFTRFINFLFGVAGVYMAFAWRSKMKKGRVG